MYNTFFFKQEIRQLIRQRRREITLEQRLKWGEQASIRMIAWSPIVMANNVALFFSFDGEISTVPLINKLWNAGKQVFLPAIHVSNPNDLIFIRYHPHSEMILNQFKISEPKIEKNNVLSIRELDVLIIPLVAFDKKGQRLGMGGGFYDRILQSWRKCKFNLHPIGYAYDFQMVNTLPTEEWDIPLPVVVTPSKLWIW